MASGKSSDEPKVKVYGLGQDGVDIVKDPLQLSDRDVVLAQNAELIFDVNKGGEGSLSKRGGLQALTSALAGSVLGGVSLPLHTTYVRTLYISLQEFDSDRWLTTVNGTSFTGISTPPRAMDQENLLGVGNINYATGQRLAAFGPNIFIPEDGYVTDTAVTANNTAPLFAFWNGLRGETLLKIPVGPSSNGDHSFGITDMLTENGKVYIAIWDPPIDSAPDLRGRVLVFDPVTGLLSQIANAFGPSTGQTTGGYPSCLAWHDGQLFVGLNGHTGLGAVAGKIVRCYPDVDTVWTTDVVALNGFPVSMATFLGELYVGTRGVSGTTAARVFRRTESTGVYASVENGGATSGIIFYTNLIVYNSELYATLYEDDVADTLHIRKTSDGTTWVTDRDVDALDGWVVTNPPINAIIYNSDLYQTFRATSVGAVDGFILRKTGGVWSKVHTDNIGGFMGILLQRS